jgi:hypothetical protein
MKNENFLICAKMLKIENKPPIQKSLRTTLVHIFIEIVCSRYEFSKFSEKIEKGVPSGTSSGNEISSNFEI